MNKNENVIVKEYEFDKSLTQKIDFKIYNCIRDCHNKNFPTFDQNCVNAINLTKNSNNDINNFTICGKSMNLYELNEKLTVARENGFIFNQINKLTIKIYCNLSNINLYIII